MDSPIFKGKVVDGKIKTSNLFHKYLKHLEDKEIEITIRKGGRLRSLQQNAYYWGVVLPVISQDTGHTPMELHALFKGLFLTKEIKVKDKWHRITGSTKGLKISDFCIYLDTVIRWANENGIIIPSPEDY